VGSVTSSANIGPVNNPTARIEKRTVNFFRDMLITGIANCDTDGCVSDWLTFAIW
jgi:hypothetical protein